MKKISLEKAKRICNDVGQLLFMNGKPVEKLSKALNKYKTERIKTED